MFLDFFRSFTKYVSTNFIGRSDDIEDNSVLRRGIPVAHKVFGVPSTINCANYVTFQVLSQELRFV